MAKDGNLSISLASGPAAASGALAAVREFAKAAACDADIRARLAIIVEEWVLNIVEHGATPPGDPIEVTFSADGGTVRLRISDGGRFFDPRAAAPPGDPPPDRGGGAGIALIRAWASILAYDRHDGRNQLLLELLPPVSTGG